MSWACTCGLEPEECERVRALEHKRVSWVSHEEFKEDMKLEMRGGRWITAEEHAVDMATIASYELAPGKTNFEEPRSEGFNFRRKSLWERIGLTRSAEPAPISLDGRVRPTSPRRVLYTSTPVGGFWARLVNFFRWRTF